MDCDQARPLIASQLESSETTEEGEGLQTHLRCCPACRAEADGLLRTWHALASIPDREPPAGIWESIEARLPARETARQPRWWVAAAFAAAGGLVASVLASRAVPYENAGRLCAEAARRVFTAPAMADPAGFFVVGFLYGFLSLGLSALAVSCGLRSRGGRPGLSAVLLFTALAVPYILIVCGGLAAVLMSALIAGTIAGALAGGFGGTWAGARLPAPAAG